MEVRVFYYFKYKGFMMELRRRERLIAFRKFDSLWHWEVRKVLLCKALARDLYLSQVVGTFLCFSEGTQNLLAV